MADITVSHPKGRSMGKLDFPPGEAVTVSVDTLAETMGVDVKEVKHVLERRGFTVKKSSSKKKRK